MTYPNETKEFVKWSRKFITRQIR